MKARERVIITYQRDDGESSAEAVLHEIHDVKFDD